MPSSSQNRSFPPPFPPGIPPHRLRQKKNSPEEEGLADLDAFSPFNPSLVGLRERAKLTNFTAKIVQNVSKQNSGVFAATSEKKPENVASNLKQVLRFVFFIQVLEPAVSHGCFHSFLKNWLIPDK